mgnify:CR=1 FL=1
MYIKKKGARDVVLYHIWTYHLIGGIKGLGA